jgi:hypothetical protein
MTELLMPRATAVWLVENTTLTFVQIADFCGLHVLEIQSIADGGLDTKMSGLDPVVASQLTIAEIKRCEADPDAKLQIKSTEYFETPPVARRKYTSIAKRQDKPSAIAWILKYYPEMPESDVCSLLGTSKITLRAMKNKTHKNAVGVVPKHPITLGLCSQAELDYYVAKLSRE